MNRAVAKYTRKKLMTSRGVRHEDNAHLTKQKERNNMNEQPATNIEAIAMPEGPMTLPTKRTLLPGNHAATVISAKMTANANGKRNVEVFFNIGVRQVQHNMWCTTEASKQNTAKQLKNAFNIDLVEASKVDPQTGKNSLRQAMDSLIGKPCTIRMEDDTYNGRTTLKVAYVNPPGSIELSDEELSNIEFNAPEEVEIEF